MRLIIFVIILTALDQISKAVIVRHIALYEEVPCIGHFFSFCHFRNRGAAWGFLGNTHSGFYLLSVLSFLISIFLIYLIRQLKHRGMQYALSLILAGSIGNLLDRLLRGSVVDFLLFHFGTYSFPAFNLADSCICIGAFLAAFFILFSQDLRHEFFQSREGH